MWKKEFVTSWGKEDDDLYARSVQLRSEINDLKSTSIYDKDRLDVWALRCNEFTMYLLLPWLHKPQHARHSYTVTKDTLDIFDLLKKKNERSAFHCIHLRSILKFVFAIVYFVNGAMESPPRSPVDIWSDFESWVNARSYSNSLSQGKVCKNWYKFWGFLGGTVLGAISSKPGSRNWYRFGKCWFIDKCCWCGGNDVSNRRLFIPESCSICRCLGSLRCICVLESVEYRELCENMQRKHCYWYCEVLNETFQAKPWEISQMREHKVCNQSFKSYFLSIELVLFAVIIIHHVSSNN
jgi:hypothetical protein